MHPNYWQITIIYMCGFVVLPNLSLGGHPLYHTPCYLPTLLLASSPGHSHVFNGSGLGTRLHYYTITVTCTYRPVLVHKLSLLIWNSTCFTICSSRMLCYCKHPLSVYIHLCSHLICLHPSMYYFLLSLFSSTKSKDPH